MSARRDGCHSRHRDREGRKDGGEGGRHVCRVEAMGVNMKRSRRSVAWDHFELKNDLVHCQHCEAIPEAGGDKEPALSDTDEGSANTGAAARLAKLARSYLCITATSVPSELD
ncbi:unnamed protein product [Pleuronectes platessa]|uniref:Uncharacterized protein n=1 Tax=Pleuronectes platessa TaxID=8262 RepID=A0A9N7UAH3_PLEPL|nr:unnamed protein product [Pleuronectes platessa]